MCHWIRIVIQLMFECCYFDFVYCDFDVDHLVFEIQISFYCHLFLSANLRHICPIVYRGGASPSYCHASPAKERSLNDTKRFRNLDFATTSYGCSVTPKRGRELLQTTGNKIRMLTFSKSTLAEKNVALKYFYIIFSYIKIEK